MKTIDSKPNRTGIVVTVLLISLLLRWILIFRGGQYYISDETRYEVSRNVARFLFQGQWEEAFRQFTLSPEHLGFKVIGVIPALLEHLLGTSLVLPAMFFSLFSVLNLYLIFWLARHFAGSSREAIYAIGIGASCLSLLYYSRHLFPYDMAMCFGLLALYIALTRVPTAQISLICGALCFLCFITYNGYWSLAGFVMLTNTWMNGKDLSTLLQKFLFTAIGFLAPLTALIVFMEHFGTNMISAYRLFATSITQGSFGEGWSLPFAYFWHTEHMTVLVLGMLATTALFIEFRRSRLDTKLWACGILFIYLCLFVPSVVLKYFVVYGRLARQMIPFLVLLSAQGLSLVESRRSSGRKLAVIISALIVFQAGWNFMSSYSLNYPRQFVAEAKAKFPGFEFSWKRLAFGAPVLCQNDGYVMESAKYYVVPPKMIPHISGTLLLSALHPSNFLPYQYDGDAPATRQEFRAQKLRMNFYRVDEAFMSNTNPAWKDIKNCVANEK